MDNASRLISIDTDPHAQEIARSELGGDHRLALLEGDAGRFLESCTVRFDLIFADAWPGKYSHLDDALGVLKPGGIYVVDDMLPQPNWPDDHAPRAAALLERLLRLPGFAITQLGWSTGLVLCVKLPAGNQEGARTT